MTGLPEIAIQFSRWLERRKMIGRGDRDAEDVDAGSDAYRSGWPGARAGADAETPRQAGRRRPPGGPSVAARSPGLVPEPCAAPQGRRLHRATGPQHMEEHDGEEERQGVLRTGRATTHT